MQTTLRLLLVFMAIVAIFIIVRFLFKVFSPKPAPPIHFIQNINPGPLPEGWKGTPVDAKKRFVNVSFPYYQNFWLILLWIPSNVLALLKNWGNTLPVEKHNDTSFLSENNTIVWLGHASFFIRINGINILIDPHFYNTSLYLRHTDNPIEIKYFKNIDYILISHDHSDHANMRSLKKLFKQNDEVMVITGLGMKKLLAKIAPSSVTITEMAWYDIFKSDKLHITFVPSRHYCKRINNGFNENLWGGFILKPAASDIKTIYFAGDSGYDKLLFTTIKKLFAPSVAIIGIGAFEPRYLLYPNHNGPMEALQAFNDTGAELMIPMHHSTFCLGNELLQEPVEILRSLQQHENIIYKIPGEKIDI